MCVCVLTGEGDCPADVLWLLGERGRKERKRACDVRCIVCETPLNPSLPPSPPPSPPPLSPPPPFFFLPSPPPLPLLFFSLTFLRGLDFSPLPHETTAGSISPVNREMMLLLLPPPFSFSLPPSLHPQQILGTVSGQLLSLFILFLLSGLNNETLSAE